MRPAALILFSCSFCSAALAIPAEPSVGRARTLDASGMAAIEAGNLRAAERDLSEALRISIEVLGENHPDTAAVQTDLALACILQGQYTRADNLLRHALSTLDFIQGTKQSTLRGAILGELSRSAAAQNKPYLSEDYALRSIALFRSQPTLNRLALAYAQVNLAGAYIDTGRAAEAEPLLRDAIAAERELIPQGRALAYALRRLAEARASQRDWNAAAIYYKEALKHYESALGPTHPELAPVLRSLAETLRHERSNRAEVRALEARAKSIASQVPAS